MFFGFVYGYMHDDPVMLYTISQRYFREFFDDYLLRKMVCGPNEYAWWPPALRLFYTFLHEKGYLEDEKPFHEIIRRLEPGFIDNLNRQFG
jgi:hypothetical protein